jgi:rsbT co-antagonist protein RsbR
MSAARNQLLLNLFSDKPDELLNEWLLELTASGVRRDDLMTESELRSQGKEMLALLHQGAAAGGAENTRAESWSGLRGMLGELSQSRARQGFNPIQTATFVLALKRPLFLRLRKQANGDSHKLADELWQVTEFIDQLALFTTEHYQKGREALILRQQEEMLELSTPVVKLWEGVLALPLVGTLDSARTQVVMESLLQKIVETGAEMAIIDITGVPTVDTLVAQHLLKTVTAARLMGADCIISGIRPQIAQTIVHLGVDLQGVTTKSSLADAFLIALKRSGYVITRARV